MLTTSHAGGVFAGLGIIGSINGTRLSIIAPLRLLLCPKRSAFRPSLSRSSAIDWTVPDRAISQSARRQLLQD